MRDSEQYRSKVMKVVQLSGGVGGARLARGFAALPEMDLTVVVNVGDDADNLDLSICPDLDTVIYTLAGLEGPEGWGRAGDTFALNDELGRFGVDNTFRLGDRDLALKIFRTAALRSGTPLSKVTEDVTASFGIRAAVTPVTDDLVRTMVRIRDGWVTFQEYFVARRHQDAVEDLRFEGAESATPAPGVLEAIAEADRVVIGPSNPPLSIWPILAVPGVREAIADHPSVTAVSPLVGGKAVKGPADRVLLSLGMGAGNRSVANAYTGLIHRLVIDETDRDDLADLEDLDVVVAPTMIRDPEQAARLARLLVDP